MNSADQSASLTISQFQFNGESTIVLDSHHLDTYTILYSYPPSPSKSTLKASTSGDFKLHLGFWGDCVGLVVRWEY